MEEKGGQGERDGNFQTIFFEIEVWLWLVVELNLSVAQVQGNKAGVGQAGLAEADVGADGILIVLPSLFSQEACRHTHSMPSGTSWLFHNSTSSLTQSRWRQKGLYGH